MPNIAARLKRTSFSIIGWPTKIPPIVICSIKRRRSKRNRILFVPVGRVTHVMNERNEPPKAYVLFRGDYDKRRDEVHPDTPAFLPPLPKDAPRNRLMLAEWLLRPDQPLTTRVTVNRFWQELFGVGLVKTTEDFGVNGESPLNQELLDWLAVDFRESGWDVKRLFRIMVTSAAYRQSARGHA